MRERQALANTGSLTNLRACVGPKCARQRPYRGMGDYSGRPGATHQVRRSRPTRALLLRILLALAAAAKLGKGGLKHAHMPLDAIVAQAHWC